MANSVLGNPKIYDQFQAKSIPDQALRYALAKAALTDQRQQLNRRRLAHINHLRALTTPLPDDGD